MRMREMNQNNDDEMGVMKVVGEKWVDDGGYGDGDKKESICIMFVVVVVDVKRERKSEK